MSLNPRTAHVAAASLNQTVGDWSGNRKRIEDAIGEARQRGARLLLLPELCIPGYSLGDRLLRRGTLERSWQSLTEIVPKTQGIVVLLGLPVSHRDVLYNAVAVVADGKICGLVADQRHTRTAITAGRWPRRMQSRCNPLAGVRSSGYLSASV